jgi:hypothetical protein
MIDPDNEVGFFWYVTSCLFLFAVAVLIARCAV